jgi:Undecaprenyl-phosphate glucose phosphotransferase
MKRPNHDALQVIRMCSDLTAVLMAWVLAYYIRFSGLFPVPLGIPETKLYFKLSPFIVVIWFLTYWVTGLYRRSGRHRSAFVEGLDILQSSVMALFVFIAFTYLYEEYRYSRVVMVMFLLLHPPLVISGRSLIRKALRRYRRRAAPRRTLLIGSGATLVRAKELAEFGDIARSDIYGVIAVPFGEAVALGSIPVLPRPNNWPEFFTKNPTETVIIALPYRDYEFLDSALEAIADQVTEVKIIPDLSKITRFAAGVDVIAGTPVVSVHESPLLGIGQIIKRAMDIIGSVVAIVIFSPVMALAACAVKLTSRGPILYKQERMGLDGRTFKILKFRSMYCDAEAKSGAIWAKPGDARTTVIGGFLRKTSLDELPQFFNVLKGDMSLVGPRPERPVFVDQFRQHVPGYYLRHKTKAGITGWAQVNGWRGNTSIERRIECDLYYIQNWSLWFDIRIIVMTVFRGFVHKNAY